MPTQVAFKPATIGLFLRCGWYY